MRHQRRFDKRCDHTEAVVTVTAGIERTACMNCGDVKIQFDHLACTVWPESLMPARPENDDGLVGAPAR